MREDNKNMIEYDRSKAVDYARKWALDRNPQYTDYENYGGDCTNFISQCILYSGLPSDTEGIDVLEKWYWNNDKDRSPSWTSAESLYRYIINNHNKKQGIYAMEVKYNELEIGDIVQLVTNGKAYHTMIITGVILYKGYIVDYLIAQHTKDLLDYPLSLKRGEKRYIKIIGYY